MPIRTKTYGLGENIDLEKAFKILRFAALLHDIGHMPFSHGLEEAFLGEDLAHEDISKHLIENYEPFTRVFEKNGIEKPTQISTLIHGEIRPALRFLKKIISHEFDADRADYLLRDSYICGVQYGKYDYIRYSGSFRLINSNERPELAIEFGNIHLVESFLLARYYYLMQVAYHRTRVGYDLAIEAYMDYLKNEGSLPKSGITVHKDKNNKDDIKEIDTGAFTFFDDYKLFEKIKADYRAGNKWAKILMREDHLIPKFDREYDTEHFKQRYLDLRTKFEEEGLVEDKDFFNFKKKLQIHKLVLGSDEAETERMPVVDKKDNNREIGDLLELSPVISQLSKNKTCIRRIYVTSEAEKQADIACGKSENYFEKLKKMNGRDKK